MKIYKILVIDDSIDILKSMVSIIENYHPEYHIYQSISAIGANKILKSIRPDLIITDWEMPELDGIEFIKGLREKEYTKDIPCIVVSGIHITPENLKTAIDAGAMDYIKKPIEAVELLARMNSVLNIVDQQRLLIKEKDLKIAENIALNSEITHFLNKLKSRISKIEGFTDCPSNILQEVEQIKKEIKAKSEKKGWKRQMIAYQNLHPEFVKNLLSKHPELSSNEIELCQMTRIGLSNKEIAILFHITLGSLRVSKSRLRKKMNLSTSQNLRLYLSKL